MSKNKSKEQKVKKYYVQGMHCPSCEILVKQDVSALEGISKAEASLSKSALTVWAEGGKKLPNTEHLNKMFEEAGYTFSEKPIKEPQLEKNSAIKIILLVVVFLGSFFFLEKSGIFMRFSLNPQSSVASYFVFGLAAGVSSCAALVGGLLLSLSKKWNEMYGNNQKQSIKPFILFNVSRILAFTFLGGALGYLGGLLTFSMEFSVGLSILVSLLMLVLGLQMLDIKWFRGFSLSFLGNNKYINKNSIETRGRYVPMVVGALTFFIPCGFTLIAQSNAIVSGSFVNGAVRLLFFSLGTLPILALISFSSVKFFTSPKFAKNFSLFAGVLIVFFALYTINSQLNVLGFKSLSDLGAKQEISSKVIDEVVLDSEGYQLMQMEAVGFEYFPKELYIKEKTKTKWEIFNSGATGCANAVYGRELFSEVIYLEPGINKVEFVSPKKGTYKVSCSMGMVSPITVHVI